MTKKRHWPPVIIPDPPEGATEQEALAQFDPESMRQLQKQMAQHERAPE